MDSQLLILDFGSQYTPLIARAVRELGVYCQIMPGTTPFEKIQEKKPRALILSGGPASVACASAPRIAPEALRCNIPVLGICYGMQMIAVEFGGRIGGWNSDGQSGNMEKTLPDDGLREFGPAVVNIENPSGPFVDFSNDESLEVWMSHGDKVTAVPLGFQTLARSEGSPIAAFGHPERKIYGVQFHPEVQHTLRGNDILSTFLYHVAGLEVDWKAAGFIDEVLENTRRKVISGNVICGLSGGVDSTVAAVLVHKAVGERLFCIFVDNGLLRLREADEVMEFTKLLGLNVHKVDAADRFLRELAGVTDPEQKRKIIGRVFIEVFEEEAHRIKDVHYLVQGTLYPDVIESGSFSGGAATIKSHHNVGGLVENMRLELIEPLRELFKDEVRKIGRSLEIPDSLIDRQPFPGPGLAVRCLGNITKERLDVLRNADRIVTDEIKNAGLNLTIWQFFAVLLPVRSVGVMGDQRTYDECVAIRAITSRDGMTADWYYLPEDILRKISSRIVNETNGVNRVVLDVSSKPPATIEWE